MRVGVRVRVRVGVRVRVTTVAMEGATSIAWAAWVTLAARVAVAAAS